MYSSNNSLLRSLSAVRQYDSFPKCNPDRPRSPALRTSHASIVCAAQTLFCVVNRLCEQPQLNAPTRHSP